MNLTDPYVLLLRGLCVAGKTTLGKTLAPELDAKIFEVGRYRKRGRHEIDSWNRMLGDIRQHLGAGGLCVVATIAHNNKEFLLDEPRRRKLSGLSEVLRKGSARNHREEQWSGGRGGPATTAQGTWFAPHRAVRSL